MSKNTGLGASLIFSGGGRRVWVAGISEWVPVGPTSLVGAPRGWPRPVSLWLTGAPPGVCSVPKILKYYTKNHTKFSGHSEKFYFRDFFYCTDNSENRKIMEFLPF